MLRYFKTASLLLYLWSTAALGVTSTVRIGVLAFQGKEQALAQWSPTAQQLQADIPKYSFQVIPLNYDELNEAVKNSEIDFVLTNPEHYVVLRNAFRISPMVTLNTSIEHRVFTHFGSVIFTRSDTRLQTLEQVRGHKVAAVGLYSFGGFLMAADTFHQHRLDLRSSDVRELKFTGLPHSRVVDEVMSGQFDVGIVRTGVLEQMALQGKLDLAQVRVLNAQPKAIFPQALSTELYAEWPWAAVARADPDLVKAVALALLQLQPDSRAATEGKYNGFSPPANYAPIEEVMRRLNVYPGVQTRPLWEELWLSYEEQIELAAALAAVSALGLLVYLWRSNRRLREVTRLYQLAQSGLQVTAAAFGSQVGLIVTDQKTAIVRANQAFCHMLGYTEAHILGQSTLQLRGDSVQDGTLRQLWSELQAQGRWQGELVCRHQGGHDVPCMVTITAIQADSVGLSGYVGSFVDVSRQKKADTEIRQLAFFDTLTELPNRRLFLERLHEALAASLQSRQLGALMFIDLDHFKVLNDTHGHTVGDQLLQLIAKRLGLLIGSDALAARLGGDEFVVMLTDLGASDVRAMEQAMVVARSVHDAILTPYQLSTHGDLAQGEHGLRYSCSASIGVALFGLQPEPVTEVLKRADVAMYQSKLGGRNTIREYDPVAQKNLNERAALTSDLNLALAERQLLLHYQMQTDVYGQPVGAECLLRWKHPTRGLVSPVEFIPLAEESGAIIAIGDWVLRTACETLADWARTEHLNALTLSVNVSPQQFIEANFVSGLDALLRRTGVRAALLRLEITEGIVLHNTEQVIEKMHQLCALGLSFSIDDFGTGYSSLSYLQRLPLSEVKIDKAFVGDLTHNKSSEAIVRAIIALGDSMNIAVVSEGVETEVQRAQLIAMGCDLLQGYLIARPMQRDALEPLLERALARTTA